MIAAGDRVRVVVSDYYRDEFPEFAEKLGALTGTVEDSTDPQIRVRLDEPYLPEGLDQPFGYEVDVFYADHVEIVKA